ncbi:hypothetical protein DSUL_50194 [Desulfovibrionales bacterium]
MEDLRLQLVDIPFLTFEIFISHNASRKTISKKYSFRSI